MTVALKEWAVVCRRLADGRQIVLLRKGGILEAARGFEVEHREFFLYPTRFHQKEDELTAEARVELVGAAHDPARVPIEAHATVELAELVTSLDRLAPLGVEHCLSPEAVAKRFRYRRPGLWVLGLRVRRLSRPVLVPHTPEYDGCKSWVPLRESIDRDPSTPALDDHAFAARLSDVRSALLGR